MGVCNLEFCKTMRGWFSTELYGTFFDGNYFHFSYLFHPQKEADWSISGSKPRAIGWNGRIFILFLSSFFFRIEQCSSASNFLSSRDIQEAEKGN